MKNPDSIRTRSRPPRIAYLINLNSANDEMVDAIIGENLKIWGGRLNPFVPCTEKLISKEWWEFLKRYDPDVIVSTVKLSKNLIEKIEHIICPAVFDQLQKRSSHYYFSRSVGGLEMPPHPNYLRAMRPSKLPVFSTNFNAGGLRRFIHRNIGLYSNEQWIQSCVEAFPQDKKVEFEVRSASALGDSLKQLADNQSWFVNPLAITSHWTPMHDPPRNDEANTCFSVVIGDSVKDFVYTWNRQLSVPSYHRSSLNQIWLSTAIANNPQVREGLQKWIEKMSEWRQGSGYKPVHFVSSSLTKRQLKSIAKELSINFVRPKCEVIRQPPIPILNSRALFQESDPMFGSELEETQTHTVTGENEIVFTVSEPQNIQGYKKGYWMIDARVRYVPDNYIDDRRDQELLLPRRTEIARQLFGKVGHRRLSRISGFGLPSCAVNTGSKVIEMQLLSDHDICQHLFYNDHSFDVGDIRRDVIEESPVRVQTAQQGRNLRGLIALFVKSLRSASDIFEKGYWQEVFELCSEDKKPFKYETIEKMQENHNLEARERNPEAVEFYKKHYFRWFKSLTDSNVFLMGINPRCEQCGKCSWYHINEVKKRLQCKLCLHDFNVKPETEWRYQLNSLVENALVDDGTRVLVRCLGELFDKTRHDFIFTNCLEILIKKEQGYKLIGDVDICCVYDGKFVIGEAKNNKSKLGIPAMDNMLKIAKLVKPDIVVFATHGEPIRAKREKMEELKKKLRAYETEVRWVDVDGHLFDWR